MDIKTQTARLNKRIPFSSLNMECLSVLSILILATFSLGFAEIDTWLDEPNFQSAELSPRKVRAAGAASVAGAITGAFGTAVDATGKIIDLLANTYGRGVGRIPDKRPCPAGLRDDGVSCWSDAHIYGKGCCCTLWGCCNKCRAGYHDDGCTCRKTDVGIKVTLGARQYCPEGYEMYGHLCYPICKKGWVAAGCCVCKRIKSV